LLGLTSYQDASYGIVLKSVKLCSDVNGQLTGISSTIGRIYYSTITYGDETTLASLGVISDTKGGNCVRLDFDFTLSEWLSGIRIGYGANYISYIELTSSNGIKLAKGQAPKASSIYYEEFTQSLYPVGVQGSYTRNTVNSVEFVTASYPCLFSADLAVETVP
jgi:hypothetical protein